MRKVLVVTATTAVGIALLSCTAPQPSAVNSPTTTSIDQRAFGVESFVRLYHPRLAMRLDRLSQVPRRRWCRMPMHPMKVPRCRRHRRVLGGLSPPRWAAVKGDGCIVVDQYPQAKFAAPAEAAKARIEDLPKRGR